VVKLCSWHEAGVKERIKLGGTDGLVDSGGYILEFSVEPIPHDGMDARYLMVSQADGREVCVLGRLIVK
jgi:hypothetical protein